MSAIRWLRVSYWAGAVADALAASLMLGWTVLLLWADRRPLARRGVLAITVFVIAGLAWAGAYAVSAGLIAAPNMVPTWVLQGLLAVLFLHSYFRSLGASEELALPKDVDLGG